MDIRQHWPVISEKWKTHEVSPVIAPAYKRLFPAIAPKKGIQVESGHLPQLSGVAGRWKWLKLLGQSTREEKAEQRENPGDLQSVSLESSSNNWSIRVWETTQIMAKNHLKGLEETMFLVPTGLTVLPVPMREDNSIIHGALHRVLRRGFALVARQN